MFVSQRAKLGTAASGQTSKSVRLLKARSESWISFAKTVLVAAGVPDQRLRNARLNERDAERAPGRRLVRELPESIVEHQRHHDYGQEDLAHPDRAHRRPQHDHQSGGEQRQRNPNHQERHAINARDRRDLDQGRQSRTATSPTGSTGSP